jgi:hypothetical protein
MLQKFLGAWRDESTPGQPVNSLSCAGITALHSYTQQNVVLPLFIGGSPARG